MTSQPPATALAEARRPRARPDPRPPDPAADAANFADITATLRTLDTGSLADLRDYIAARLANRHTGHVFLRAAQPVNP